MRLTAKISRNFRDVATGAPKVLLRAICTEEDEFRDHAWVELTPKLCKVVDSIKGNRSLVVELEADESSYEYRAGVVKRTLTNINKIKVVGRA